MVVVDQIETAGCRHGVKLMVWQSFPEMLSRGATSAIKLIVRVIHLVATHYGFEAAFVERAVVCHEGQALNERLDLTPNVREHGSVLGVLLGDAVDERVPIEVIVRLGLDEGIERVDKLALADNHHAHAANAATLVVGGLEVYGGEGVH